MVYVVGHRGAPFYEPENTIKSFKKAIEFGVDFIECDVHLTKDKKVVVIHDDTLDRKTNGKGYVKDFSLEELRKLSVEGKGKIPTLEEVLKLDFSIMIELKSFNVSGKYKIYPDLVKETLKLVENFKSKLIFISFDPRYLEELKNYPFERMLLSVVFPSDLNELRKLNLAGLGIKYTSLNFENIKKAHENNFKILAWTVNDEEEIKKILESKVDFIGSDDPKLAVKCIKEFKAKP